MEFNGTTITQSLTIARFLAKQYHLAGQSHMEEAQADMIVDCVADVFNGKFMFQILGQLTWFLFAFYDIKLRQNWVGPIHLKSGDFYKTSQKMIWHHLLDFLKFVKKRKLEYKSQKFIKNLIGNSFF